MGTRSSEGCYAHGVLAGAWPGGGGRLPPGWALQDPADWLEALETLYRAYRELHDHFGRGGTDVLRRLSALRRTVQGKDKEIA